MTDRLRFFYWWLFGPRLRGWVYETLWSNDKIDRQCVRLLRREGGTCDVIIHCVDRNKSINDSLDLRYPYYRIVNVHGLPEARKDSQ